VQDRLLLTVLTAKYETIVQREIKMELAIAAAVIVVVIALIVFKNSGVKGLEVLDVNQDGKVDSADVTAAVTNVKQEVKRTATRAKAQVKKTVSRAAARKPAVKRPTAKK